MVSFLNILIASLHKYFLMSWIVQNFGHFVDGSAGVLFPFGNS